MGQITLNHQDALRVLSNPEAGPDARVIAAMTCAFFETVENIDMISRDTSVVVRRLAHMITGTTYGETRNEH